MRPIATTTRIPRVTELRPEPSRSETACHAVPDPFRVTLSRNDTRREHAEERLIVGECDAKFSTTWRVPVRPLPMTATSH
jgi:hypothetical protein